MKRTVGVGAAFPFCIERPTLSQEENRWGFLHGSSQGCEPSQEGPSSSILFALNKGQSLLPQILGGSLPSAFVTWVC